jgi:DNA-binding phage protein
MKAAVKFESVLKDHLADAEQAAKYLTACYEEGPEVFLQGSRDVVEAQGGMSRAARLAGLQQTRWFLFPGRMTKFFRVQDLAIFQRRFH